MTILLIIKALCVMAVAIAFCGALTGGVYAFLKHFGYFDETPAPQTSEQMDET